MEDMGDFRNSEISDRMRDAGTNKFVDGKKFFAEARARLSFELFSRFLALVKQLNSKTISKERAINEVRGIFGSGNEDLYEDFVSLLSRRVV